MTKASDNEFPSLLVKEGTAPASPASGDQRLFVDSSDHLLKLKNSSGTVTAVGGGGSGSITASGYTQSTARLLGRSTASTGAIEEITVGSGLSLSAGSLTASGGGSSRPYISGITLDGTYGDDFTGASLAARWTQRGSAAHTYQSGGGSWLRMDHSSGASELIYQTAPAGDFEVVCAYTTFFANTEAQMIGPFIASTAGTGIMACHYYSALNAFQGTLSSWAYGSGAGSLAMNDKAYQSGLQVWMGLKKSGTNYSFRYSHDGYNWSPYSATSSQGFTVGYIGFGRHLGTDAATVSAIDVFNVI